MIVAKIALSEAQAARIKARAAAAGTSEAEIVRQAVGSFLGPAPAGDWKAALRPLRGIWQHAPEAVAAAEDVRAAVKFAPPGTLHPEPRGRL